MITDILYMAYQLTVPVAALLGMFYFSSYIIDVVKRVMI